MLQAVACCINTQLRTSNHAEVYPIEHSDFDACNCVANAVLQFLYRVQIWFVYRTFQVSLDKIAPSPPRGGGDFLYMNIRIKSAQYRNFRTSATQLQPSEWLCYIGYTSTWWQHNCWLTVETLYPIYILTPERISKGHVQNGRRATFSWPTLYN